MKGGTRDGAGRKRKLSGRIRSVSVGMTDEMLGALIAIAKARRMTFQKLVREIAGEAIRKCGTS